MNNDENVIGLAKYWSSVYSYVADLLEDKQLARKILLIDYDEFCQKPSEILDSIYSKCDLFIDKTIIEEQARTISAPKYYKHNFTNDEIDLINKETRNTLNRLEL